MSIGRTQALALRENFLNSFGRNEIDTALTIIEKVLEMAAGELMDVARDNLHNTGSVSTGELQNELKFNVEQLSVTEYVLHVGYPAGSSAAKYWDFNNKGVQGVKKPGNAPNSPYKFRYLGVSPKHALALMKWYRHNGRAAANIHKDYAISNLESKRVNLRQSIKQTDSAKSLAYATAMKMKIEGIKPSNYFDDAVKEVFGSELMEMLAIALGGDVILNIRKYGDNI